MIKLKTEIHTGAFKYARSKSAFELIVQKKGFNFGSKPNAYVIYVGSDALSYREIDFARQNSNEQSDVERAAVLVGTTPNKVLDAINSKKHKGKLLPGALILSLVILLLGVSADVPNWALMFASLILFLGIFAVHTRDESVKTTVLFYELSQDMMGGYTQFYSATNSLKVSAAVWNLVSTGKRIDPKYNAGAHSQVDRIKTIIRICAPPYIQTNVEVFCIEHAGKSIYFFPDRILVSNEKGFNSIPYSTLQLEKTTINFVESEIVPSDALTVGKTWRYVNKSGGPDKRFKDNRELPLCHYEILRINSSVGFSEEFMLSKCGVVDGFIDSFSTLNKKISTHIRSTDTFEFSPTDSFGYPSISSSPQVDSKDKSVVQNDVVINTLSEFLARVGPPPLFNFSAIEKNLPVGLKLHGQKYVEVVFAKVEKSPGDSYGRICIMKYKSSDEANTDFQMMLFYTGKFVLNPTQSDFRCIKKFYSNSSDGRLAFLGQTGHWIVHGVFPIRGEYESYLEDLFSVDSANHYLANLIKHRVRTTSITNVEAATNIEESLPIAVIDRAQHKENCDKPIDDGTQLDIQPSCITSSSDEIELKSTTATQVPLFRLDECAESSDGLTTFVLPGEPSELVNRLTIPVPPETQKPSKNISIPTNHQPVRWYSKNESIRVKDFVIEDGLVLVGTKPENLSHDIACLIDPSLEIANEGDYRVRSMGYWPKYAQISPESRTSFLQWLSSGKSDSEADIGFVFLYFYGLEKRYFDFIPSVIPSEFDMSEIYEELKRLRTIYGVKNKSFEKYLDVFLEIVRVTTAKEKLYELELPLLKRNENATSLYLRVLIGQAMRDQFPLDFQLVKFWIELDTKFNLSDIPTKLEAQSWFWHILEIDFLTKHPSGMIVPDNDSVLCIDYRPASPPWTSESSIAMAFDNVPDMATVSGLHKQLQSYIDNAAKTFEPLKKVLRYSRNTSIDELFFSLPAKYWKDSVRQSLKALLDRCIDSSKIIKGSEFNAVFETPKGLPKQIFTQVISQLRHTFGVDIVPSAEEFVVSPTSSDSLILYRTTNENNTISTNSDQYNQLLSVADSTVELAAFVAHADTVFSDAEFEYIVTKIDSWTDLVASDRLRFSLKLKLLRLHPRTLSSIKVRVNNLLPDDRIVIFEFIRDVVSVDGVNSQQAAQLVRNISSLLDMNEAFVIDPNVSTPLAGSELVDLTAKAQGTPRFTLDTEKIAELQKESRQISVMLGAIFEQEQTIDPKPVHDVKNVSTSIPTLDVDHKDVDLLKGLDKVHTQFLRTLVSRSEWTRADVEAVSRKLELMTDGAIERINDAAFEQFDMPLIEGDDPIEINLDLIENLPL